MEMGTICTGTSVVPPDCGLLPTMVYGYALPCQANDPEKCGTLKTRPSLMALRASLESLLAASNRGCAPWLCKNPPAASIGGVVSREAAWAEAISCDRHNATIAPKIMMTRRLNRVCA